MSRLARRIFCLAAAVTNFACPVAAQSLKWDALGSAGGRVGAGTIALGLTAGQAATGRSLGASFIETVGFWHPFPPGAVAVEPPFSGPITTLRIDAIVPNPSAGATAIHFAVPAGAAPFTIEIIDLSGRVIRVLHSGRREAGHQSLAWDGRSEEGSPSPSGIYFCRLKAAGARSVRRLAVIR
jgi:flagellar hook capping protein FlgD